MIPVFITGTGTGVGKTIVSVIVSKALQADYWKPVQSGNTEGTDSEFVSGLINNNNTCLPEVYNLAEPASPHIAARQEGMVIDLAYILQKFNDLNANQPSTGYVVIEGAGGLMVPLNDYQFIVDLVLQLRAKVILVSRNYLGSINHSLLTAAVCKERGVDVIGWIFNDDYLHYHDEISAWSGYPVIGAIPRLETINSDTLSVYAMQFRERLLQLLQ